MVLFTIELNGIKAVSYHNLKVLVNSKFTGLFVNTIRTAPLILFEQFILDVILNTHCM